MEAKGEKAPKGEHISEASPEVRELRELAGKLTRLTNVVLGFAGGRPIKDEAKKYLTAHPEPNRERIAQHKAIVARMLPSKRATAEAESPTAPGV